MGKEIMNPVDKLKQHCQFNNDYDCHVLLAIVRKKDVENMTHSKEITIKEIIKNKDEIESKYNKIMGAINSEKFKKYPFYFYVSVNARDTKKAAFSLMDRFMKYILEETNGVNHSNEFKRFDRLFYSELMKPSSIGKDKKFLIDVDTKYTHSLHNINKSLERIIDFSQEKDIYETKHGYHYVVAPFDVTRFVSNLLETGEKYNICEVKKDALLFIDYIERRE